MSGYINMHRGDGHVYFCLCSPGHAKSQHLFILKHLPLISVRRLSHGQTIDAEVEGILGRIQSNTTVVPPLQIDDRVQLERLASSLKDASYSPGSTLGRRLALEIVQASLSCPPILAMSGSQPAAAVAQIAHSLALQMRIIQNAASAFEQSLAASRAARMLGDGLRLPSQKILNALFIIDGQSVTVWWFRADSEPAFAELLDCLYQAVKIWGWNITASAALWSVFRQWQWLSLWKPATEVILRR
jgi:hypothetical protein